MPAHSFAQRAEPLDYGCTRSGAPGLAPRVVSAGAIARTAVRTLMPIARHRGIRLTVLDDCAGRVLADHDRTAEALATILAHALAAAPTGTSLGVVATRLRIDRVRLAIEDPASVIAPEHRAAFAHHLGGTEGAGPPAASHGVTDAHVWEAGLRLTIARALVERQGGAVGSTPTGRTTVCWVELPGADEATDTSALARV